MMGLVWLALGIVTGVFAMVGIFVVADWVRVTRANRRHDRERALLNPRLIRHGETFGSSGDLWRVSEITMGFDGADATSDITVTFRSER